MSTLVKSSPVPSIQEMDQLIKFCQVLSTAPYYQKMGPGGVLAIYLTARELNLPMMLCMNGGLYTFDGKVTMSAQLMKVMIINAGGKADIVSITPHKCSIKFVWKGISNEYEYSIDEARAAGYLTKDNWKKHPKDMLYARALSGGARKYMPEVIMGAYVLGEMDNDPQTIIDPIFSDIASTEPTLPEQKVEEAKMLEHDRHENFEAFVGFHNIRQGDPCFEYVKTVCERGECSFDKVINQGCSNPDKFKTGYQRWLVEQKKPEQKKTETDKE